MKLYGEKSRAPNPRKVYIFLSEKQLTIADVNVPLRERKHKSPEFLAINSLGQIPVLETDDGVYLSESVAICRYLEELFPAKPLFGRTPLERAVVEMWIRRADFRLWEPMRQVWRNDDARTEHVVKVRFSEHGKYSRLVVQDAMLWFDREMADGREFLSGDAYTMADITLQCGIDFCHYLNMDIPVSANYLRGWHGRVSSRECMQTIAKY